MSNGGCGNTAGNGGAGRADGADGADGIPYETIHTFIPADNISSIASTNCTVAKDLTNKVVGDYGVKMTTVAAVTATILMDPIGQDADPLVFDVPPAAIGVAVFIEDVTKVSQIQLNIYSTVALNPVWIRTDGNYPEPLKNGWNYMRFPATEGDTTGWGSVYRVRVLVITSAATSVTVGRMWAEIKPKAQLVFIEDGGYTSFLNDAYPDLKSRGIPVTWSIDPLRLGEVTRITEADVKTVSDDGNDNSISFHGFDGAVTSTMTPDEIVADTVNSIKWLSARGYAGRMWRSAWVQNSAPNADAASSLILGGATPNGTATMGIWPPKDRYDIPRVSVHGSDTATIDAFFDSLKLTHGLMVIYTHGIADVPPPTDVSTAQWLYFLSKVDVGISEGWLEFHTFESLFAGSGGVFNSGFGVARAEFLEVDGSKTTIDLM